VKRFCFSLALIVAAGATAAAEDWALALPGWKYEFPRDHFSHPDFKTEWWYFTGNVSTKDGRELGYQLTFFRQGVSRQSNTTSRFATADIKLAHFAVSDLSSKKFHHGQKISRGAFAEAGFDKGNCLAWIDDWSVCMVDGSSFRLRASYKSTSIDLLLTPRKPPVLHGAEGISQKSAGEGRASHYYSLTRLETSGTMMTEGQSFAVQGWSWFDQEWATNQLTEGQVGWDWFSFQFDDGSELMMFQIRLKDGGRDPYSHGTFVHADGSLTAVKNEDFTLEPNRTWKSDQTPGVYPVEWSIRVPKLDLNMEVKARMDAQELVHFPISYWEGSISTIGERKGVPISGRGYLEMTGYAGGLVGLQAPDTR
jgi:predicted secreted hydrolase